MAPPFSSVILDRTAVIGGSCENASGILILYDCVPMGIMLFFSHETADGILL
jgi:hypothetical protein